MKEFEINKDVQKILNPAVLLKQAEKHIENKINILCEQYRTVLSECSKCFKNTQIQKYYEEECLKLTTNAEESKETESQLNSKINEQKKLVSKKLGQLLSIMNDSKNVSFDSAGEVTKKKLIEFEVALNAAGFNICYDAPENVISGFIIKENLSVPVQPFEFNLKEMTETELNYKMWELVKENSNNTTSDYENLKDLTT